MFELNLVLDTVALDRTDIPSEVTLNERKVLKYISQEILSCNNCVVDLGSAAGSTVHAIMEGLHANTRGASGRDVTVHAYDWFSIGPGHYASEIFRSIRSKNDPNFLMDFKYNLSEYIDQIQIYSGDVLKENWDETPIELLHVDLCKNNQIYQHIVEQFYPAIAGGGKGILVHQDFSRPRLPWLHYSAGVMADDIEPIAATGGSVFYKVQNSPSANLIAELTANDISLDHRKAMVIKGIEAAAKVQRMHADHFICLEDLALIFVDYWFDGEEIARDKLNAHPNLDLFDKYYPELVAEIHKGSASGK